MLLADGPEKAFVLFDLKEKEGGKTLFELIKSVDYKRSGGKDVGSTIVSAAVAPRRLNNSADSEFVNDNILVALAYKQAGVQFRYEACSIGNSVKNLDDCIDLRTPPGLYDVTISGSETVRKEQLPWSIVKVLLGDFNGDGYVDILQVRDGVLQLGRENGFENRQYKDANNSVKTDVSLVQFFDSKIDGNQDYKYHDDFLIGAPVIRDAYYVNTNCFPDLLDDAITRDKGSTIACVGMNQDRVARMYKEAKNQRMAVGASYNFSAMIGDANVIQNIHRWQFLNTDGEAVDLDRDGDLDLVMQVPSKGTVVFYNRGDGYFYNKDNRLIDAQKDGGADTYSNGSSLPSQIAVRRIDNGFGVYVADRVKNASLYVDIDNKSPAESLKAGEIERSIVGLINSGLVPDYLLDDVYKAKDEIIKNKNVKENVEILRMAYYRATTDWLIEAEAVKNGGADVSKCKNMSNLDNMNAAKCASKVRDGFKLKGVTEVNALDDGDIAVDVFKLFAKDLTDFAINSFILGSAAVKECMFDMSRNQLGTQSCMMIHGAYAGGGVAGLLRDLIKLGDTAIKLTNDVVIQCIPEFSKVPELLNLWPREKLTNHVRVGKIVQSKCVVVGDSGEFVETDEAFVLDGLGESIVSIDLGRKLAVNRNADKTLIGVADTRNGEMSCWFGDVSLPPENPDMEIVGLLRLILIFHGLNRIVIRLRSCLLAWLI